MRKLTVIFFALLITVSAVAAPPSDSSERHTPGPIARIVRQIKIVVRALTDGQPIPPQPVAHQ